MKDEKQFSNMKSDSCRSKALDTVDKTFEGEDCHIKSILESGAPTVAHTQLKRLVFEGTPSKTKTPELPDTNITSTTRRRPLSPDAVLTSPRMPDTSHLLHLVG